MFQTAPNFIFSWLSSKGFVVKRLSSEKKKHKLKYSQATGGAETILI